MRVFISYAFADTDTVRILQRGLEKSGIVAYLAVHDLRPSKPLAEKIQQAIECSDALVALITKKSDSSASVNQEIAYAKARRVPIIPLVEQGAGTGVLLQGLEFIPLDTRSIPSICRKIVSFLDRERRESESRSHSRVAETVTDQTQIVRCGGFCYRDFNLRKGEVLDITVESDNPINVLVVDTRNFNHFIDDADFAYEEGEENIVKWIGRFKCPKSTDWTIIVDNTEGRKNARVNLKVMKARSDRMHTD